MSSIKEFFKNVAENEVSDFEKDLFIKEKGQLDANLYNSLIQSAEVYLIEIKGSVFNRLGNEIPYIYDRNNKESVIEDITLTMEPFISYLNGSDKKPERAKLKIDLEKEDIQKFYSIVIQVTSEQETFIRFYNKLKEHLARIEGTFPIEFRELKYYQAYIDLEEKLIFKSDHSKYSFIWHNYVNKYLSVENSIDYFGLLKKLKRPDLDKFKKLTFKARTQVGNTQHKKILEEILLSYKIIW